MGLFSSKKTSLTPDKEQWQLDTGSQLASWAQKYLKQYQPGKAYEGTLPGEVGMAPGEVAGQDWLMQYMNQPATGANYDLAKNEIQKTLTGQYDPASSDFYKATRTGALKEEQDAVDRIRRGAGARGTFFQDTGIRTEGKARENTANYLQQLLGSMAQQERQNRLGAVAPAMQLEQYAQGAPLAKASAGMTLGSLPRLIEQGALESKYQDFLRKQQELSGVSGVAQGVLGTSMNYGVKDYQQSSPFERIMQTIAPIAGTVLGSALGPGGAWAGGAAGKAVANTGVTPSGGGAAGMFNFGG